MITYALPQLIDTVYKCVDNMFYGLPVSDEIRGQIVLTMTPKFVQMAKGYEFIKSVIAGCNPTSSLDRSNVSLINTVSAVKSGDSSYVTAVTTTSSYIHSMNLVRLAIVERARLEEICKMFLCKRDIIPSSVQSVNDALNNLYVLPDLDTIASKY